MILPSLLTKTKTSYFDLNDKTERIWQPAMLSCEHNSLILFSDSQDCGSCTGISSLQKVN